MSKGNRRSRSSTAAETVALLRTGTYRAGDRDVDIRELLAAAVGGTRSYSPDESLPAPLNGPHDTAIEVVNATTIAAARALAGPAVALNFASAKKPGGGFRGGSQAQEESLARKSALFACIEGDAMYEHHRARRDPMYTNWAIYSPRVPVVRDEEEGLLEEPWTLSFITCPAVNAKVVLQRDATRGDAIRDAMAERIERVLAIAQLNEEDTLVLGAWGCGVFGNDPETIAGLFHDALHGPFQGAFARVVFAVLDYSPDERFIGPFKRLPGVGV